MARVSLLVVALMLTFAPPVPGGDPDASAKLAAAQLRVDAARRVRVLIRVAPMSEASERQLLRLGCVVERVRRDLFQAWVPVHALHAVAALPEVRSVRPADALGSPGIVDDGDGDAQADLGEVRRRFAVSGRGVRVGVVSLGIRGLAESVAAGHLPATRFHCRAASRTIVRGAGGCRPGERLAETSGGVMARSFRADGDLAPAGRAGAEGTAALELVHRAARGAELWFANPETDLDYLDAVEHLAGVVDVLVSDIVTHSYFPDGRNVVSETVAEILAHPDTRARVFVQPAGNLARGHYAGEYLDAARRDGPRHMHLFVSDAETEGPPTPQPWNRITVPPWSAISIFLTWPRTEPAARYRLMLVDCASGRPVEPPDVVSYTNPSPSPVDACYAIRRPVGTPSAGVVNVTIAHRGDRVLHRFNTPSRSILPPADTRADVIVVGAVPASRPDRIEPFSSRGPTFDGRPKPDVVSVDRLAVSGAGGYGSPFVGTSASAAYVGGLAALLLEINPELGRADVIEILRQSAIPLDGANVFGAGRVDPIAAALRALERRARR
ncbi:MAG: S8 family serine peptidase [Candidatus Rokubacteria bacterium]|nr:S8 family serine peptidase [Candidatus Rokubacteria bacterium]